MKWPVVLREIEAGKNETAGFLKELEKKPGVIVALDERGKSLGSAEFCKQLYAWENVTFVIGGADGLDEEIRKKADFLLSFGKQTWPHMLVRVMLLEQIYRAQQIASGHPYHRE